jgi:hypothetical protein
MRQVQAAEHKGRACRGPADCKLGEDACPPITETSTTTIKGTTVSQVDGGDGTPGCDNAGAGCSATDPSIKKKTKGRGAIGFFTFVAIVFVLYFLTRCIKCKKIKGNKYTQERFLNPITDDGSDAYVSNGAYDEGGDEDVFNRGDSTNA